MKNTLILCRYRSMIVSALISESGRTLRIWSDRTDAEQNVPGTFYLGRVTRVLPSIQAAFVEYDTGKTGYLPLEKAEDPFYVKKGTSAKLQQSDELIVQIDHETPGGKRTALTADLTLAGQYAVLDRKRKSTGVSKKIPAERREELKRFLESRSSDYGMILRTNAESMDEQTLSEELDALEDRFRLIFRKAEHSICPCCLSAHSAPYLSRLKDLNIAETGSILTDDQSVFRELEDYLGITDSPLKDVLCFWKDSLQTLAAHYSLESRMKEALQKKVWLKSGAFLVIEQTEALVSIDVNSGKASFAGRKDKEDAAWRINMEAAKEIAAQLVLRSLSGIILIDFINMETEESKEKLLACLQECFRTDPGQPAALGFTRLNLIEAVRRRSGLSFEQSFPADEKKKLLSGNQ